MQKLSIREKIGYGVGDAASCIVWNSIMYFLPKFYTDTFGLSAAAGATMFFVVRFWDAVNDPMMGYIADRTNTRWGKFRPWILWMAVPYGIGAVLLFTTPNLGYTGKLVYAYITYTSMMMIYTAINIPYCALSGVISSNSLERTSLTSYRFFLVFLAILVLLGTKEPLVNFFGKGDYAKGYRLTMTLFAAVCVLLFMVTFFSTKERIKPPPGQKSNLKADAADLLRNRPWIVLFFVSMLSIAYVSVSNGVIEYYFDYYVGRIKLSPAFMVSGTAAILLSIPSSKWLTKKFGKRNTFMVCMFLSGIFTLLMFFARPGDIVLLFVLKIFSSLTLGPTVVLLWAMFPDTADYSEWKNGRRATGLIFSAMAFSGKFGGAVGGWLTLAMLSLFGYVPNVQQNPMTLIGIRMMFSVVPAIGSFLIAFLLLLYKLDEPMLEKIEKELIARRANGPGTAVEIEQ